MDTVCSQRFVEQVGLMTTRLSPVLIVDFSPPRQGTVNCPKFVQGKSRECSLDMSLPYYHIFVSVQTY